MKMNQFRFWLCFVCALAASLWIAWERLFAPEARVLDGVLWILGFGCIAWVTNSPSFFKRFVGEATPETLGAIRIVACASLIITALWVEDMPRSVLFPTAMRSSFGIMKYFYALPGFEVFVRSEAWLQGFEWLTVAVLFLGLIGWKTRIMIPLGAICYVLLGGIVRQYLYFYHQGLIPVYVLAVLSLTPCGDGLSIDRLRKVRRGQAVPPSDQLAPIYGWSRYACWVVLALAYVASGSSKLRVSGLEWLSPLNLRGMMYACTLQRCNNYDWDVSLQLGPHLPDAVFLMFGLMGTVGEIFFISVLFSAVARRFMPILMVLLHLGIYVFQNILFLDFILLQLIFVDFTQVRQAIAQKFGGLGRIQSSSTALPITGDEGRASLPAHKALGSIRYPIIIATFTLIVSTCWFYQIKFYPLSSLHLFAYSDQSGVVSYNRLYASYESGITDRIYPERIIPAQFVASYRRVTNYCFLTNQRRVNICQEYLQALGTAHNRQAKPGERIKKIEVQQRRWDFVSSPSDSNHGTVIARYSLDINDVNVGKK